MGANHLLGIQQPGSSWKNKPGLGFCAAQTDTAGRGASSHHENKWVHVAYYGIRTKCWKKTVGNRLKCTRERKSESVVHSGIYSVCCVNTDSSLHTLYDVCLLRVYRRVCVDVQQHVSTCGVNTEAASE